MSYPVCRECGLNIYPPEPAVQIGTALFHAECIDCHDEITGGMLKWKPGSLSTATLDRILTDVLADLWADSYRRDDISKQIMLYLTRIEAASYAATGRHSLVQ